MDIYGLRSLRMSSRKPLGCGILKKQRWLPFEELLQLKNTFISSITYCNECLKSVNPKCKSQSSLNTWLFRKKSTIIKLCLKSVLKLVLYGHLPLSESLQVLYLFINLYLYLYLYSFILLSSITQDLQSTFTACMQHFSFSLFSQHWKGWKFHLHVVFILHIWAQYHYYSLDYFLTPYCNSRTTNSEFEWHILKSVL